MKNALKYSLILLFVLGLNYAQSQTVVSSLEELKPYLSQDNVDVKLTPGTYTISEQDVLDRVIGDYETISERTYYTLFLFTGDGSTYDFTDVTFNIETAVFQSVGNYTLWEIRVAGNDITLKNLTMIDVGSEDDAPTKTANNIVMDGKNNVVEGFDVQSTGSYPYGYGDIFGKGGSPIIQHRKHSAILIRGESNTLRNTNLVHKAYGHCVFFQAASSPTVEGCYIEGEVRTSDDMLTEEGTGTIGDEKEFMTVWDYKLPSGFMVALCEAGIRAYNAGTTIVDGDTLERSTSNVTVKNTTVRNTRTACTLVHSSGTQYVENVTSIGNENGFSIGNGEVVNCRSDAAYGAAFSGENGVTGDVTIIAPENGYYNGTNGIANVTGGTVTIKTEEADLPSDLFIKMGTFRSFRHQQGSSLLYQLDTIFSGATVYNYTGATVELGDGASDNDVSTCGEVIDYGTGNNITYFTDCEIEPSCGNFDALSTIEAEEFCETKGASIAGGGVAIGSLFDGDWVKYNTVDFGDSEVNGIELVLGKNHEGITSIDIYLDDLNNESIATIEVPSTGGWYDWETVFSEITSVTGIHDVYLSFNNEDLSTGVTNVESFKFIEDVSCLLTYDGFTVIEAEDFCEMSGVQAEASTENGDNIGYINNGDYIKYANIDFSTQTANSIDVRVSSKFDGGQIEIRTGSEEGTLIGSVDVVNTGGNQAWETNTASISNMTGLHDIYLVFTGEGEGYLFNVNYFQFKESIVTGTNNESNESINVYPNPTNSELFISDAQGATVELYNNTGELKLSNEIISTNHQIDMTEYVTGIYFMKIISSDRIITNKIVKK